MKHISQHSTNGNGQYDSGEAYHTLPAELTRLISVAIISERFRDLLLHDSARALDAGFHGQQFMLTPEQRNLVLSIQATTLTDFATQLTHIWVRADTSETIRR